MCTQRVLYNGGGTPLTISRRYWPVRYRFDSRDNRLLFDDLEVYIPEELGVEYA